jgi:hypothetical protein
MNTAIAKGGGHDPLFHTPYVDIDEWRDGPVRHRYVHGAFEGTDARFSMYFPPTKLYQGRFFQPLMPVSGTEHGAATGVLTGMAGLGGYIDFATASGAYLVESNLGRLDPFPGDDPTITNYRTSAAVARYSRVLAAEMYGEHRAWGYVFGGSGGAYKTIFCVENEIGLWDGAVPYVHPSPMSLPNVFSVQSHAIRILRDKFPAIVDALEPGGSGDMYAGLSAEQREALAEVTKMGCPPRSWFDVERVANQYTGVWSMIIGLVLNGDPKYFEDFWTLPGYLGADAPASLARARVQHKTTVTKVVTREEAAELGLLLPLALRVSYPDAPVAVRVEALPDASLQGATLTAVSGKAAGRVLYITSVSGDVVSIGFGAEHSEGLTGIEPNDEVLIDNSIYLAAQTYHRHQVHPDFSQWDQFQAAGQPVYPQRPRLLGPLQGRQTGRFAGKMIVVQALMDEAAWPCQAEHYRRLVEARLGSRTDDHYRLWFIDHALHTTPMVYPGEPRPVRTTRVISYLGVLQQALRDLSDWVEKDLAPPPSTTFDIVDNQVFVPATAPARKGIQPVVTLAANGSDRADVAIGETVQFTGTAEVPPEAGSLVAAEWDFEGAGDYPVSERLHTGDGTLSRVTVTTSHAFGEPGTYFPVLRVTAQRQGDPKTSFGRVQNLARVRVVVN